MHRRGRPRLRGGVPLRAARLEAADRALDRRRRQPHARHGDARRDARPHLRGPQRARPTRSPCRCSCSRRSPPSRFVYIERRMRDPLVPLRYFRRPGFSGPMIAYFAGHIAYMGGFVISPILLKDVFGYTKLSKITALLDLAATHVRARVTDRRPLRRALRRSPHRGHRFDGHAGVDDAVRRDDDGRSPVPLLVVALIMSGCRSGSSPRHSRRRSPNSVDAVRSRCRAGHLQHRDQPRHGHRDPSGVALRSARPPCTAVDDFLAPYAIGAGGAAAMLGASFLLSDQRRSRNST